MCVCVPGIFVSTIALPKRLPSGEAEKMQRAIQSFLVLREFIYTMLNKKDNCLPLKEDLLPTVRVKDTITVGTSARTVSYMFA